MTIAQNSTQLSDHECAQNVIKRQAEKEALALKRARVDTLEPAMGDGELLCGYVSELMDEPMSRKTSRRPPSGVVFRPLELHFHPKMYVDEMLTLRLRSGAMLVREMDRTFYLKRDEYWVHLILLKGGVLRLTSRRGFGESNRAILRGTPEARNAAVAPTLY